MAIVDLDLENKPGMSRNHWFILMVLLLLYVVSRLLNLAELPPFMDEALHIDFSRMIRSGEWGTGSGEGKWLSIVIMTAATFLPADTLLLARLVSVISGLFTIWAIILTGRELFSIRITLLAVAFYVFIPYVLFYNRLALTDGIVAAFGAWILFVSVRCLRTSGGMYSVLLAALLLASFLAKASGLVYVAIPVLAVAVLLPRDRWRIGLKRIAPALLASLLTIPALYVSDVGFSAELGGKTQVGATILNWSLISRNFEMMAGWYWILLTPPVSVMSLLLIFWVLFISRTRQVLFMGSVMGIALIPYIFLAEIWYPRYLIFAHVPLVLLLASFCFWGIDWIQNRSKSHEIAYLISAGILLLLLAWPTYLGARLVTAPETASVPPLVKRQYINGWPAGYGIREMTTFLQEMAKAADEPLQVLRPIFWTHTNRGGLDLYRQGDENMALVDMGLDIPAEIEMAKEQRLTGRRTLFILDSLHPPSVQLFELVRPYFQVERIWYNMKPGATGGLEVWEVNIPPDEAGLGRPGE